MAKHHKNNLGFKPLSGIGALLSGAPANKTNGPSVPCAVAVHEKFIPLGSRSLSENIYRLMSDFVGRTVLEISKELTPVADYDLVKTTMALLTNASWFDYKKTGAFQDTIYTLKRNLKYTTVEKGGTVTKPAVKKFLPPPVVERDPAGIVTTKDSLDSAIWKAMSDRRQRSIAEVGEILKTLGFDREVAKDHFMKLVNREWFIRHPKHGVTFYTLKKCIQMPVTQQPKPVEVKQPEPVPTAAVAVKNEYPFLDTDTKPMLIWKVLIGGEALTADEIYLRIAQFGFKHSTIANTISELKRHHDWFTLSYVSRGASYKLKPGIPMPSKEFKSHRLEGKKKPLPQQPLIDPALIIQDTDPVSMKIWKVMSDHKPYTSEDVTILLELTERYQGQVFKLMSEMGKQFQCFNLERSIGEYAQFTLISGLTMPDRGSFLALEDVVGKKHYEENKPPMVKEIPATVVPKLVEVVIRVKGIDLTVQEAVKITKRLVNEGYAQGKGRSETDDLLSTTVSIKGIAFTSQELEEVTKELIASGFNR